MAAGRLWSTDTVVIKMTLMPRCCWDTVCGEIEESVADVDVLILR